MEKKSIKWLKSRNDPAATGIQPVRGREQLIVSYTIPPGDLPFLIGRSYTYDNAAGAIAMSRTCYAMAVDKVFIRACAKVHPIYKTPHVAVLFTTGWAILLTLTGSYEQLYTYVTFASLLFGIGGGLAIFVLRIRQPNRPRPYRTCGFPLVPSFFVLGSLILVVNTLIETPNESGAGLILVALGIPAYFYWRR